MSFIPPANLMLLLHLSVYLNSDLVCQLLCQNSIHELQTLAHIKDHSKLKLIQNCPTALQTKAHRENQGSHALWLPVAAPALPAPLCRAVRVFKGFPLHSFSSPRPPLHSLPVNVTQGQNDSRDAGDTSAVRGNKSPKRKQHFILPHP